ncbi:MAG: ABC transporter ATP-binding protein [Bacteroidetes bacterium]|nr:ABC transporter ATP-binding protein [Bacteroidota bacterium]
MELRIEGLSVALPTAAGWKWVLREIWLRIGPGERIGLWGPSGGGKSLLLRAALGLLPEGARWEGEVYWDGRPLRLLSARERCAWLGRRIGVVFQEPLWTLDPVRRCGAQLAELVRLYKGRLSGARLRQELYRRLAEAGLEEPERIARRYPHELSGGQRQRLSLALALAGDPELLVADEPTTALDVLARAAWLKAVGELARGRAMSLWVVSHDPDVLRRSVERVWRLEEGRLIEERPARKLPTVFTVEGRRPEEPWLPPKYPLLQVENLHVLYPAHRGSPGAVHAVRGVSFSLGAGEILHLVGRSGCGKSSLLRAIPRLIEPSKGEVWLRGCPVRALEGEALRAARRQMPIVFQDPYASLNPRLTVCEQLLDPMRAARIGRSERERLARAEALLLSVGLEPEMLNRYPDAFSGGQRQRLAIARALATEPPFLLCDEALSALDAELQEQFVALFSRLRAERRLSLLFVTHDFRLVRALGGRVAVMADGELVEMGPVEALCAHPRHPETQRLLEAARWLAA